MYQAHPSAKDPEVAKAANKTLPCRLKGQKDIPPKQIAFAHEFGCHSADGVPKSPNTFWLGVEDVELC